MAPIQGRNTRCDSLSELFLKACKNGDVAKVNAAIVLEVDVNIKYENWPQSGLILAIRGKNEAVVDLLLSQPDIDINAKNGRTFPLAVAASLGLTSIVAKLGRMPSLQGVNERAHDASDIFSRIFVPSLATPLSLATKRGETVMNLQIKLFSKPHGTKMKSLIHEL